MALLLLAALGLLWFLVSEFGGLLGFADLTKRASLVVAFGLYQLLVFALAELTSLGHHFTAGSEAVAWATVVLIGVGLLWRDLIGASKRLVLGLRRSPWKRVRRSLDIDQVAGVAIIVVILAVLVVTGWLYPPSNSDSMAYHLARVEHWIQNRSVTPYAAHYLAQIELAPLGEYNLATLHQLTHTDRFDGYVQLSSTVICILGASELARRLGLSGRGQVFTALLVATIPTLLLEATSTTNNVFAAAIGVTLLVVLTSQLAAGTGWLRRGAAVGAMLGLAQISKGTLFALLGPVTLALIALAICRSRTSSGWTVTGRRIVNGSLGLVIAAVLVAGPFLRATLTFSGAPPGQ